MPDGFTGYVWTETVSEKKKKLRIKKYPDTWVWRHIGDIIDSHISWPWKHFFTSKVVSSSYLVIVNYLRSVGSVSSSRRVLRSCHRIVRSSGHRWPFFESSIPFDGCYVLASFSCLRVVLFSFRRL